VNLFRKYKGAPFMHQERLCSQKKEPELLNRKRFKFKKGQVGKKVIKSPVL